MLNYDPKQADALVLDNGDYDAEIDGAEDDKKTKKGDLCLILHWRIFGGDGLEKYLRDWIVLPSALWRLKLLCDLAGLQKEFASPPFDSQRLVGLGFKVTVIQTSDVKYGKQNKIYKYISLLGTRAPDLTPPDENIPF